MQAPAKKPSLQNDAALLTLCTEFTVVHADYQAAEQDLRTLQGVQAQAAWEACEATLWPLHAALLESIIAAPAVTLAGVRAKAAVLRLTMATTLGNANTAGALAKAEPHERLAWSLANDLAGEAEAPAYGRKPAP